MTDIDSLICTSIFSALLLWGVGVGIKQIWTGYYRPDTLFNPLFRNRHAMRIFVFHMVIVSLDLFVCGPLSLHFKSPLWYWGGLIALLTSSIPLAVYFNRYTQSFGILVGLWVRLRNFFEIGLHIWVASIAVNWFYYYMLLWWILAYRYLDVGPRRLLQTLYNTPQKLAQRPWAPFLDWFVIASIYVLAFLAVYCQKIIYAAVPEPYRLTHSSGVMEYVLVISLNIIVFLMSWSMIKKYTDDVLGVINDRT